MTNEYWEESPWFWTEIKERKDDGGLILVAATGPPNYGKTYWSMGAMEDLHADWGLPKLLDSSSVVFNASQFRRRMETCGEWECTLWDEPNKGLSHRDWYLEMNKEVTTYIQTFRFRHKPLFLALPHIRLLDKSARAVLVAEAMMKYPSLARVHQIEPDMYGNREFFKYFRGEVQESLPNRKFRAAVEQAKEEFHRTDFPESKFQDVVSLAREYSWQSVKQKILAEPTRFQREIGKATGLFRFSAKMVSYELSCSDNTARRAIYEIEKENRSVASSKPGPESPRDDRRTAGGS